VTHQAIIDVIEVQGEMNCTQAEHEACNSEEESFSGIHGRSLPYKHSDGDAEQNNVGSCKGHISETIIVGRRDIPYAIASNAKPRNVAWSVFTVLVKASGIVNESKFECGQQ
jgi:hypothetical protein